MIAAEGYLPNTSSVMSKVFGRAVDVRYYIGTPEKNSSGVPFSEAALLWDGKTDWRNAIASIKEDPSAQRFDRETDVIPLRSEQLYHGSDVLEDIVRLKNEGVLDWRFLPFEAVPDPGPLTEIEERIIRVADGRWGKRTQQLIPYVLSYLRQRASQSNWETGIGNSTEFTVAGVWVGMGRPWVPYKKLDELECSRIALIPHFSRRGPNGLWEIRRGPQHPIEVAFSLVGAYVLAQSDRQPNIIVHVSQNGWSEGNLIELYARKEDAQTAAEEWAEDFPDEELRLAPQYLQGSDLLDVISLADILDVADPAGELSTLYLTDRGMRALDAEPDEKVATTNDVIRHLQDGSASHDNQSM